MMLLNGYDTTVGKLMKAKDDVASTLRYLHATENLIPTDKENVFVINNENAYGVKAFGFPLTLTTNSGKPITVIDERHYVNKKDQLTNVNERVIYRLAAYLQQDVIEGNLTPLKNGRKLAAKAFADALSSRLGGPGGGGLDITEMLTLKIILVHYFICIQESDKNSREVISYNVVRELYGADRNLVMAIIEDVGDLNNLIDLCKVIAANPTLYKLKNLGIKDMIHFTSGIIFTSLGGSIVSSACELPCFFTALVFAAAQFKFYQKTPIGMAVEQKFNRVLHENFVKNFQYTYKLGV